jgi:ABC-type polysaccharide/polyol phosphate transport system ATPase subunit
MKTRMQKSYDDPTSLTNEPLLAVKVQDLHIKYKNIKKYSIKQSLLRFKTSKAEEFHALKGVSFDIPKGQILGIVGKNGSGKSTLLRAIAGIFSADEGTIDLFGNSISLLSIGVGFQTKLTGYENIYLSGMLLGFSESDVKAHFDEIVEFSELGEFINKPVKTYSSGMHSKLAFSITAILKTDIILIDEVLSVGDASFKIKSYEKMKELISDDQKTVVIVSHSSSTIRDLCKKVLWLHDGLIREIGPTEQVMDAYDTFMTAKKTKKS